MIQPSEFLKVVVCYVISCCQLFPAKKNGVPLDEFPPESQIFMLK